MNFVALRVEVWDIGERIHACGVSCCSCNLQAKKRYFGLKLQTLLEHLSDYQMIVVPAVPFFSAWGWSFPHNWLEMFREEFLFAFLSTLINFLMVFDVEPESQREANYAWWTFLNSFAKNVSEVFFLTSNSIRQFTIRVHLVNFCHLLACKYKKHC